MKKMLYFCTVKVDRFVMIATTRKNAKHMISKTTITFLSNFYVLMSNIKK